MLSTENSEEPLFAVELSANRPGEFAIQVRPPLLKIATGGARLPNLLQVDRPRDVSLLSRGSLFECPPARRVGDHRPPAAASLVGRDHRHMALEHHGLDDKVLHRASTAVDPDDDLRSLE